MTRSVYEQHAAAFANVAAYVILQPGSSEVLGNVTIKFPKDGAGRLTAFVKLDRIEMVRGFASGWGYDKRSAAVASCKKGLTKALEGFNTELEGRDCGRMRDDERKALEARMSTNQKLIDIMGKDSGEVWDTALRNAGFIVCQVL